MLTLENVSSFNWNIKYLQKKAAFRQFRRNRRAPQCGLSNFSGGLNINDTLCLIFSYFKASSSFCSLPFNWLLIFYIIQISTFPSMMLLEKSFIVYKANLKEQYNDFISSQDFLPFLSSLLCMCRCLTMWNNLKPS